MNSSDSIKSKGVKGGSSGRTSYFVQSRRDFLRSVGAAGLTVIYSRLAEARPADAPGSGSGTWSGAPGMARFRIEGVPKVTGQKIYARDFRARDMEGWPTTERLAMVLRATMVDRPFLDIDLSVLPQDLKPLRIIRAEDLARDAISFPAAMTPPAGRPGGLFVAKGKLPVYYGQPLAMLIFADFTSFRRAKLLLQFNDSVPVYGHAVDPDEWSDITAAYLPPTYLTRVAENGKELFSQVKDGNSNPKGGAWVDRLAKRWRSRIATEFTAPEIKTFEGSFETQVIDPLFMEPEAGLGWLEKSTAGGPQTLHLVLGTQSANGDLQTTLGLFASERCPIKLSTVALNACYPGGGFGGRDVSTFPVLLALAAAYADGPVRIVYDRFDQFQSGLKQLGSTLKPRLAVDRQGRFRAIEYEMVLTAGGNNNYSQWVAQLAGLCGGGSYNIDKVSIDAIARPTAGVVAGSMRGFGGPQAFFAIECLIDEVAAARGVDAIDLRARNVLNKGDRTVTGAPLQQEMRLREICDRARANPLWAGRAEEKRRRDGPAVLYGVGFALSNQAFGTDGDGVMAEVSIAQDGRIAVRSNAVDMGNGSATSLAVSTASHAGANAATVALGEVTAFIEGLGLSSFPASGEPNWDNPRYTASFSMSSSACITAFHQVHAVEQATRMLFLTGLLPAACILWGRRGHSSSLASKVRWKNGLLTGPNLRPLAVAEIASAAHAGNGVVATMVHAFNQAQWVVGNYTVDGAIHSGKIDGLSTRLAQSTKWRIHDRWSTVPPPPEASRYGRAHYAPSGTLAAVEVNRGNGAVSVSALRSYLDAGRIVQRDLVIGQHEGAAAMGIGYALLEDLPLLADGGGSGRWNLDRYSVALARHVPLGQLDLELLGSEDETAKGIAEAVLCPIVPAIVNAIAHATGRRFRSLPVTAAKIREALT